ncbi:kinase [Aurantiacibacter spongiae]|uniref:Kinase n=1 Tax=Aurantiacibacter spongiae TaxID=2488860 RepID=A0A3N5CPJ2_9SPHN|nr:kinase [Aurantiacibacter spongiae]RPF70913.1 kinase [Aurantiacibacter spongiae]
MTDPVSALVAAEGLPADYHQTVEKHWRPLADRIARTAIPRASLVIGISGPQGSGKTTACRFLELLLRERALRAVTLSLDDLYLSAAERRRLADGVHPLFATRGPPGTHSVGIGLEIVERIRAGRRFALPRFDKALDDRSDDSVMVTHPVDILLLEGWCVGAMPQRAVDLAHPVNALEAECDPDGIWRGLVNRLLDEEYRRLFDQIDVLVMLRVADFDQVVANRRRQERKLAQRCPESPKVMDDAGVIRFCAYFERLTRHMLAEMPPRADIVIDIDADHLAVR